MVGFSRRGDGMIYTKKQAKRIAMIKAAHIRVKTRKALSLRVTIEDLIAEKVTLDKGSYTLVQW